jgi:hypothetical protein
VSEASSLEGAAEGPEESAEGDCNAEDFVCQMSPTGGTPDEIGT